MKDGITKRGYPSKDEICKFNGWPSQKRFAKGPVAIVECVQEIPCNPCEKACPFGAIIIGNPITNIPRVDFKKCTGCGKCLASCPGLAIFLINKSQKEGLVTFPFEYFPLPEKGDFADALDRSGKYVCEAEIVRINKAKINNRTALVTIKIPLEYTDFVRTIKRPGAAIGSEFKLVNTDLILPDEIIVCRCEEVTAGEIRKAVRECEGMSVTGIKRRVRSGMGLCQGRSCGKLVTRIIMEETGRIASEITPSTDRPPVRLVTFGELAEGETNE